jgi:hypothetical protein
VTFLRPCAAHVSFAGRNHPLHRTNLFHHVFYAAPASGFGTVLTWRMVLRTLRTNAEQTFAWLMRRCSHFLSLCSESTASFPRLSMMAVQLSPSLSPFICYSALLPSLIPHGGKQSPQAPCWLFHFLSNKTSAFRFSWRL